MALTKEKMKALTGEILRRFAEEGLTVREARRAISEVENEITKIVFEVKFQIQDPAVSSAMTDANSSDKEAPVDVTREDGEALIEPEAEEEA